jgi:hypothetical protein
MFPKMVPHPHQEHAGLLWDLQVSKGYLTASEEPLSEMENKVVDYLFVRVCRCRGQPKS